MPTASLAIVIGCAASACAPTFHPIATVAATHLDVARLTGRWSNVYLLTEGAAAIAIDGGSPVDCEHLTAAIAGAPKLRAVIVTHARADPRTHEPSARR